MKRSSVLIPKSGRLTTDWVSYLMKPVHLTGKTRELVKLALAIGGKLEGAAHSHTRRALAAGATPREVLHVVLLGITTLGFPSTITAITWIEDVLGRSKSSDEENQVGQRSLPSGGQSWFTRTSKSQRTLYHRFRGCRAHRCAATAHAAGWKGQRSWAATGDRRRKGGWQAAASGFSVAEFLVRPLR